MCRTLKKLALVTLIALTYQSEAAAQLFGQRSFGRTPLRRAQPSEQIGQISGSERFLRGNRRATDFVGRDSSERRSFVGVEQGAMQGRVRSAVSNLRPAREPSVNRPPAPPASRQQPYPPRLTIDFRYTPRSTESVRSTLQRRLADSPGIKNLGPVEVRLENRTAILEGEVASEHDRVLAEQLARLEPGISQVRNLLRVAEPLEGVPARRE